MNVIRLSTEALANLGHAIAGLVRAALALGGYPHVKGRRTPQTPGKPDEVPDTPQRAPEIRDEPRDDETRKPKVERTPEDNEERAHLQEQEQLCEAICRGMDDEWQRLETLLRLFEEEFEREIEPGPAPVETVETSLPQGQESGEVKEDRSTPDRELTQLEQPPPTEPSISEPEPPVSQPPADVLPHSSEPGADTEDSQKGKRPPLKRGGRPRTDREDVKKAVEEANHKYPKPEIVCWQRERQWVAAVEVPEDLLADSRLAAFQNGLPLVQDAWREDCWRLWEARGHVVVRWDEEEATCEEGITLGAAPCLLFKLSGEDKEEGRYVRYPSSGLYLAMVPQDWARDESSAGSPPRTPEPVSMDGYEGHFFILEKGSDAKIAFHTPAGKRVVEATASRFELIGARLKDANEDMGPLFGQGPPQILAAGQRGWRDIATVVVGEEGAGRHKWRTQFSPEPTLTVQELPSELAARGCGWYFLRFYDTDDDLVESMDFRFLTSLMDIRTPKSSPLPSKDGHHATRIEFLHDLNCSVQHSGELSAGIHIERSDERTAVTIPPDPLCDLTRWRVCTAVGPSLEVAALVERVWWAIAEEDNQPTEWGDRPVTLCREDFRATSRKAVWIRFPRKRWTNGVLLGFAASDARRFEVRVTEEVTSIPLRDFGDAQELGILGEHTLGLWIPAQPSRQSSLIGRIVVKAACKFCDFLTDWEEKMFSHIQSFHMGEFFRTLTYEELRSRVPSLPAEIYKCGYCPAYTPSDDLKNLTSTIIKHLEVCPKVPRGSGPIKRKFGRITDVDEIRRNVLGLRGLPLVHGCNVDNVCTFEVAEDGEGDKRMDHLIKNHRTALYQFR